MSNSRQQCEGVKQQAMRGNWRLLAFVVLVISASAATLPVLASGAAAAEIDTADRTIDAEEIGAGDSVNVTVEVELDESGDPALFENITPAAGDIGIQVSTPEAVSKGAHENNEEVLAIWNDTAQAAIVYTVTAHNDATDGATYSIDGLIDTETASAEISGDAEIVVNKSTLDVAVDAEKSELEVDEDENITVAIELTNTGAGNISQDIDVLVAGDQETTLSDITLAAGTSTMETVTVKADDAFDGEELQLTSEDDSDTVTLAVESEDEEDDQDDDGIPGFTMTTAVVALIIAGLYVRTRPCNGALQ